MEYIKNLSINPKLENQIKEILNETLIKESVNDDNIEGEIESEESLRNYATLVESYAQEKSKRLFLNSSNMHAAIVLTKMLKYSKKEFIIYDDNLSGDVADKYHEFYHELITHVVEGKSIRIVVDNGNYKNTKVYKILKLLSDSYPNKVDVRKSNEEFKALILKSYEKALNFAVGDEQSFRIEELYATDVAEKRRNAYCSFNIPDVAKSLKSTFEKEFLNLPSVY